MSTDLNGEGRGSLDAALEAWRKALGPEQVSTLAEALAAAATATFATTQRVPAVLRPANRDEVQQCVRIANRFRVPIYPVSTGKNWGYGSRVPTRDGSVILDLGRLNRIVGHDEKQAHVTVEPGVTMRQLFDYLQRQGSNLMMNVTGSSPDTSLIGNILERGVGQGPYGERCNHVCALEVVLPTAECVHTGFDRFPGARAARLCRWGVGPSLDGLFSQSNLGIVTQMTLWLLPRPRYFQVLLCWLEDESRLGALIESLQGLRLEGSLRGTWNMGNDYRTLGVLRQYPWEETGGRVPLPEEVRRRMRKASRGAAWNALAALYSASRAQGRADRRRVRQALRGKVDRLFFIDPAVAWLARWVRYPYRWLTGIDLAWYFDALYHRSVFLGHPTDAALNIPYWRKKRSIPADKDPDRDRCGIVFCAPCVPSTADDVGAVVALVEKVLPAHGFEPMMSLIGVGERYLEVVVYIVHDRDEAGEDARAMACHDELLAHLTQAGYLPYRLGLQSMQRLPPPRDDTGKVLAALKGALDPNRILAPGRYEF